jgi:hypothetical protein
MDGDPMDVLVETVRADDAAAEEKKHTEKARNAAVQAALAAHKPVVEIMRVTRLSRTRIYQIRDGVRT